MVSNLEFVLLAVDDDGGDLLVHEDEDKGQKGGNDGSEVGPPGVHCTDGRDEPAAVLVPGRL